jgi:DNA-binding NarL/FixJ family response regulator
MALDSTSINVAIVDDHAMLREALAMMLSKLNTKGGNYKMVLQAQNGVDFIEKLKVNEKPDVVILDISMPKMDGYQTADWLKTNLPDVKILILTMYDSEDAIITMLEKGVEGYLLKNADLSELQYALQRITEGGTYLSNQVTKQLTDIIIKNRPIVSKADPTILDKRDIEIIQLIVQEKTAVEIGENLMLSARTVEGIIYKIMERLKIKTRAGLVVYAIKNQLVSI